MKEIIKNEIYIYISIDNKVYNDELVRINDLTKMNFSKYFLK